MRSQPRRRRSATRARNGRKVPDPSPPEAHSLPPSDPLSELHPLLVFDSEPVSTPPVSPVVGVVVPQVVTVGSVSSQSSATVTPSPSWSVSFASQFRSTPSYQTSAAPGCTVGSESSQSVASATYPSGP